jgi:hypothetical protein
VNREIVSSTVRNEEKRWEPMNHYRCMGCRDANAVFLVWLGYIHGASLVKLHLCEKCLNERRLHQIPDADIFKALRDLSEHLPPPA